ncbi:hypothetical protein T4A_7270 [Trichinella pseudospiralis]|uniref:Uncharacterized protein n=1 Tax=Trichinella pseudospiralis TaxID=6337 RepID=A0A0V1EVJ4_TRIPS|nr:hypothetical protein T4A_7270 [Trichinella pseudospiralis]
MPTAHRASDPQLGTQPLEKQLYNQRVKHNRTRNRGRNENNRNDNNHKTLTYHQNTHDHVRSLVHSRFPTRDCYVTKLTSLLTVVDADGQARKKMVPNRPYSSHNFFHQRVHLIRNYSVGKCTYCPLPEEQFPRHFGLGSAILQACWGRRAKDDLLTSLLDLLKALPLTNCGKC